METEKPKTLSNAISGHQSQVEYGAYLLSEQTRCERAEAGHYNKISEVLSRPELKNAAIVDESTRRVYLSDESGVVRNLRLVWANNIPLDLDIKQDGDTIVSVGEAS